MNDKNKINWIGIDVAKKELEKLIKKISQDPSAHLVFEASGGYEKPLLSMLQSQGIAASRVNAIHVRNFAKAKGLLAKTDAIDARVLSDFGIHFKPSSTLTLDPVLEEIESLVKYRRRLNNDLHRERMLFEHTQPKSLERIVKKRINAIKKQIEEIDLLMTKLTQQSAALNDAVQLLTKTNGVGENSALSLLVAMPELGKLSHKQAASLAGLAPFNCDSGKMRGKRKIYGGRTEIRKALYMAALVATRYNDILKEFYHKLLEKGKPKKLALIAVMRTTS